MKSLKSLLDKKSGGQKLPKRSALDNKDVFYIFSKIIKEEFGSVGAAKLKPDYFNRKILHVRAESPTWAAELWLNKKDVIRKLNAALGANTIDEIKTK